MAGTVGKHYVTSQWKNEKKTSATEQNKSYQNMKSKMFDFCVVTECVFVRRLVGGWVKKCRNGGKNILLKIVDLFPLNFCES